MATLDRQPARQYRLQRINAIGLGQVVVHACCPATLPIPLHRIGRQRDHRHTPFAARFAPAQGLGGCVTIEHGHLAVHQHQIDRLGSKYLQRLLPVASRQHCQPHAFKLGPGNDQIALVVFRNQYAPAQFRFPRHRLHCQHFLFLR